MATNKDGKQVGLHAYVLTDMLDNPDSHPRMVTLMNADGPFEASNDAPAALLVRGPLGTVHIELEGHKGCDMTKCIGPMAGGAFVATSDSRFSEAVSRMLGHSFYGAVSLHDHYEVYSASRMD